MQFDVSLAVCVYAPYNLSGYNSEEKCYGQSDHQTARECLKRSEEPPFVRQEEVTVTKGRVSHAGKIERRLGIWQTVLPPENKRPDSNLNYMNQNELPCDANQYPYDWPETRLGPHPKVQHVA